MWWKILQASFKSALCLGNTEKGFQLILIPLLCVCILGHLVTQTTWLYKTYRNSAKRIYFGLTSYTRITSPKIQSSWKSQPRKAKTEQLLPNVHDISRATGTCNVMHLLPKDVVTRRSYPPSRSLKNLVLRLFIEQVTKYLWKMINSQMIFRSQKQLLLKSQTCTCHAYFAHTLPRPQRKLK